MRIVGCWARRRRAARNTATKTRHHGFVAKSLGPKDIPSGWGSLPAPRQDRSPRSLGRNPPLNLSPSGAVLTLARKAGWPTPVARRQGRADPGRVVAPRRYGPVSCNAETACNDLRARPAAARYASRSCNRGVDREPPQHKSWTQTCM